MIKMGHLDFLELGSSAVYKQTSAWHSSSDTCGCISYKAGSPGFGCRALVLDNSLNFCFAASGDRRR